MTPWRWWAGDAENVEGDGQYDVDFDTRQQAVAWAIREYGGSPFYVIEARSSTAEKYSDGSHEIVPFLRTRNKERLPEPPENSNEHR